MANGTTDDKLHEIRKLVDDIRYNGCSKREVDVARIDSIETTMREMRNDMKNILHSTIGSMITLLVLTVSFLLKYILFK